MSDVGLMLLGAPAGVIVVAIGLRFGRIAAVVSWVLMVLGMSYLVEALK